MANKSIQQTSYNNNSQNSRNSILKKTKDIYDESSFNFSLIGGPLNTDVLISSATWIKGPQMGLPVALECKWFQENLDGNLILFEGITGPFFQPCADDVGYKICVQAKPTNDFGEYEGKLLQATSDTIQLDPKTELQANQIFDEGIAKLEARLEEIHLKLENHPQELPCECMINLSKKQLAITVGDKDIFTFILDGNFPQFKFVRKSNNAFELYFKENSYFKMSAKNNLARDLISVSLKIFIGQRLAAEESQLFFDTPNVKEVYKSYIQYIHTQQNNFNDEENQSEIHILPLEDNTNITLITQENKVEEQNAIDSKDTTVMTQEERDVESQIEGQAQAEQEKQQQNQKSNIHTVEKIQTEKQKFDFGIYLKIQNLSSEIQKQNKYNSQLLKQIQKISEENFKLQQENDQLQQRNDEIYKQMSILQEEQNALNETLEIVNNERIFHAQEIELHKFENNKYQALLVQKQNEIDNLLQIIENCDEKEPIDSTNAQEYVHKKIFELQLEKETLQKDLEKVHEQVNELLKQKENQESKIKYLERKYDSIMIDKNRFIKEDNKYQEIIDQLKIEFETKINNLQNQVDSIRQINIHLREALEQKISKNGKIPTIIEHKIKIDSKYNYEFNILKNLINTLMVQLTEQDSLFNEQRKMNNSLCYKVENLEKQIEVLIQQNIELQEKQIQLISNEEEDIIPPIQVKGDITGFQEQIEKNEVFK